MLVELHDAQRELDHASLVVDDYHAARAQEFAAPAERVKVHVHLPGFLGGQDKRGRSAGHYGLQLAPIGYASAHVIDHLLERIAERKLIYARLVDVPAQAEEARATVLGRTIIGELLPAHKNDVRHGGDGLHVVDDRRPAPKADHGKEGRPYARDAALAFERLHQRRLFSHFIGPGAGVPVTVKLLAAAEDIFAQKAFCVCVSQGFAHDVDQIAIFAANVDKPDLRAHGQPGDDDAFNHGVGIVLEDRAVLAGAGFAL